MEKLETVNILASWTRVAESPEWIATRTDELLRNLSVALGIDDWHMLLPSRNLDDPEDPGGERVPWAGDLPALVRRSAMTDAFDSVGPDEGYSFGLHGRASTGDDVTVSVDAGDHLVGRRIPRHRLSLELAAADGGKVDDGTAGILIKTAAQSFDPQIVERISPALNKLAGRKGWQIRPSSHLWLHDDVLVDPELPRGMSAERVGSGSLYSVPTDWTHEQVNAVHNDFRALNGIDVLPH
ncbi:hypothetical protein [Microbacterium sp. SA39]|uniref:hypothetical protein n=1 Tax=Microbacterium sp. SA39 TaxID=1263625 RepID=UPI00061E2E67|nr:hypothetical protein [Microbacterium sp. SA39]KJQ55986.1 hypothetical protein RS85_00190 [Microbacterium sp. SA39]